MSFLEGRDVVRLYRKLKQVAHDENAVRQFVESIGSKQHRQLVDCHNAAQHKDQIDLNSFAAFLLQRTIAPPTPDAVTLGQFFDYHNVYFTTVRDIRRMVPGERALFLCFDRNFDDLTCAKDGVFRPDEFFEQCYFIHFCKTGPVGDISGTGGTGPREGPTDRETKQFGKDGFKWVNTADYTTVPFNWEIEWSPGKWYPMSYGNVLPSYRATGWRGNLPWESFSDSTLLGWRGPCIRYDIVQSGPSICQTKGTVVEYNQYKYTPERQAMREQLRAQAFAEVDYKGQRDQNSEQAFAEEYGGWSTDATQEW